MKGPTSAPWDSRWETIAGGARYAQDSERGEGIKARRTAPTAVGAGSTLQAIEPIVDAVLVNLVFLRLIGFGLGDIGRRGQAVA